MNRRDGHTQTHDKPERNLLQCRLFCLAQKT